MKQLSDLGSTAIATHFREQHNHELPLSTVSSILHSGADHHPRGRPPSLTQEQEEQLHQAISSSPMTSKQASSFVSSETESKGSYSLLKRIARDHGLEQEKLKKRKENEEDEVMKIKNHLTSLFNIRKKERFSGIVNCDETRIDCSETPMPIVLKDKHVPADSLSLNLRPWVTCSLVLVFSSHGFPLTPLVIFPGVYQHPHLALQHPRHHDGRLFPVAVAFTQSGFNRTTLYEDFLHKVAIPQLIALQNFYKQNILYMHDTLDIHTHIDIKNLFDRFHIRTFTIDSHITSSCQPNDYLNGTVQNYIYDQYISFCKRWKSKENPDVGLQRNLLLQWICEAIYIYLSAKTIRKAFLATGAAITPATISELDIRAGGQLVDMPLESIPDDGMSQAER